MLSHAVSVIPFTGIRLVMASTGYFGDGPPMRERDPYFTEVISQSMRVPERLRVGPAPNAHEPADQRPEDLPAAYSMHIPDRLALTGIFHIAHSVKLCSVMIYRSDIW